MQYEKKEEEENFYGFLIWGGWEMGSHLPASCSFNKFREAFFFFWLLASKKKKSEQIFKSRIGEWRNG